MADPKKKILFLCTGNAARSQMAEALARIDYGDLLDVVSAGSRPAEFVHSLAIRAIEELGFDMDEAHSKSAAGFIHKPFDLVVTVCDSAAQDCPSWPGAKHLVHWPIEDPTFAPGDEAARLAAFRATRDDLRLRIDRLMEALRRPHPRRSDAELLTEGARILEDVMRGHGFKLVRIRKTRGGERPAAVRRFTRRGRALELHARSGVAIAYYEAAGHRLRHPDYMECLGAAGQMRYPGLPKDPLDAFRRLRTDLVRFARPFLSGKGLEEFRRCADVGKKATRRA